jgi:hypothetical protein
LGRRAVRCLSARSSAAGIWNRLASSLVLVTNRLQALGRKFVCKTPGSAINVSVTLWSAARALVEDVFAKTSLCIAGVCGASLSIVAVLCGVLALIFGSNPNARSRITVGIWFTIEFAFFAVGLVIILSNTRTKSLVTNSDLAVCVELIVNSKLSALSINLA